MDLNVWVTPIISRTARNDARATAVARIKWARQRETPIVAALTTARRGHARRRGKPARHTYLQFTNCGSDDFDWQCRHTDYYPPNDGIGRLKG